MKGVLQSGLYLFVACVAAWAQPLTVYSELAQIDSLGKVTAPETPREILSPALVRNGFTSFQVVVDAPSATQWSLFVGQNPENAVKVTMYRESGSNGDTLERVDLPYQSSGTQVLWMDLWTERNAPVQRIKVEPELKIDDDWMTYPIEARVMEAVVPDGPRLDPENGSARSVWRLAGMYACDFPPMGTESGSGRFIERWRARNVEQDVRLAEAHSAKQETKRLFGSCSAPQPEDPEWYLRVRDYLFRLR